MYFVVAHLERCSRKVPMGKDKIKDSLKNYLQEAKDFTYHFQFYCEDGIKDLMLHKSWP